MENKKPEEQNKGLFRAIGERLDRAARCVWGALSRNVWMKLLSLLLAILLWNYVISTDTSITRSKAVGGLTGYVTGLTGLNANRLSLLEDPTDDLQNITVTVEVPQTYYSRVSSDNVQVTLDLSSVRTEGTQEVPLRAATTFGRVTDISPETLTLTFEALDSRSVPINSVVSGDLRDDYWYSITRLNPSYLTVSGAGSVVRNIGSATVTVDVTDHFSPYTQALPFTLTDASGEEISQEMLSLSSSSVSVSVDIFPCKELPISTDLANVITGQPAEGYVVQSVTMQPDTITVAADRELLDGLTELMIEPVSVDGMSQSFTTRSEISMLSGVKNLSANQVYVNVVITEASVSGRIDNVSVLMAGKREGLSVEYNSMSVIATGPRSIVESLQQDGIFMSIDLTGLGPGSYELEPVFDQERYPSIEFKPEHERMTVILTEVGTDD